MQKGEYRLAIEEFKKVIEVEPRHAPSYSNLALCYERMGNFDDAVAVWKSYVRLLPPDEEKKKKLKSLGYLQ